MSRWTHDGAHIAADVLLTVGLGGMLWRGGWEPVALCIAGSLLLGLLRALETRDGHRQAVDALAKATALEARLEAVEKAAEEAKKTALAASTAASSRPSGQRLSL